MSTRQDFVNWIKGTMPDAYSEIGADKLQQWVRGLIFGVEDKWFVLFQTEGGTQHLENIMAQFLNIPSRGYDDFSGEKQNIIDQYTAYVAKAKAVLDQSNQELAQLTDALSKATDETQKTILQVEISNQLATIQAESLNYLTWAKTLSNFLQGKVSEQVTTMPQQATVPTQTPATPQPATQKESTTSNEDPKQTAKPASQEA